MKKMNKKGFTLIELLAVIVILGLLMAIAIPSVTRYITQSRKKTLVNTISNYMSALTTDVNNNDYTFTDGRVYAVPITCIAVERGGSNPFGQWTGFDGSSWAYVLVQYDDTSSSYTYGFTFKDTAGYGLHPNVAKNIDAKGDIITTTAGSALATAGIPASGDSISNTTGFKAANLHVLTAGATKDANTCIKVED